MGYEIDEYCEECGGKIIADSVKGDYICGDCGLSLDMKYYDFRPSQSFDNPKKIHYEFITSNYSKRIYSLFSKGGFRNRFLGIRLKNLQDRYSCGYEQIDNKSYHLLKNICKKLNLPKSVLKQSVLFFSELSKSGFKGKNTETYSAACIYLSARLVKIPLDVSDFQYNEKQEKIVNRRIEEIKIKLKIYPPLMLSKDYVTHFFEVFRSDISVRKLAVSLSEKIDNDNTVSGTPQITAMAVIVVTENFLNGVNFRGEIKNFFGNVVNLEKRIKIVEAILKEVNQCQVKNIEIC